MCMCVSHNALYNTIAHSISRLYYTNSLNVCIQTCRVDQALLVYTATDSLSHNSDAIFNAVTLCSAWPLKTDTWMPLSVFYLIQSKFQFYRSWFYVVGCFLHYFKCYQWKRAIDCITLSHVLQLLHSLTWCHMVSRGFVLDQLEHSAIIWCHVVTCGPHPWFCPLRNNWKSKKTAVIVGQEVFVSIGRFEVKYWETTSGRPVRRQVSWPVLRNLNGPYPLEECPARPSSAYKSPGPP